MSIFGPFDAIKIVQGEYIEQYISISICALLVYDTILTFDDEIKYLWTRRWCSPTHILFFINRYIGILSQISSLFMQSLNATTTLCLFGHWTFNIGSAFNIIIIDYILVIRVVALWENNKILSAVLKTIIFCEAVLKIALIAKTITTENLQSYVLGPGIVFCGLDVDNQARVIEFALADWSIVLLIGFILLILAMYKVVGQWRSLGMKRTRLVNIMIKDQIIYYFVVLFCSVVNIVEYAAYATTTSISAYALSILGDPVFLCLFGGRMFINLKKAAKTEINDGSACQASICSNYSNLDFGSPVLSTTENQRTATALRDDLGRDNCLAEASRSVV